MLRLYDAQAGAATPVVPARPRRLTTYTAGAAGSGPGGAAQLRAYLLADVVRRVAEQHSLLVTACRTAGEDAAGGQALKAAWALLNIHPLEPSVSVPAPLDLGIGPQPGQPEPGQPGPRWLQAGPVRAVDAAGASLAAISGRGLDPLALRLVFLRRHYREPVELTWADLAAADQTVREWRALVASWANSPSKPMSARYTGDIRGAFDEDLGTPAALRTVAALAADPGIPPGSKFETFVSLDHLLGLDLARDIGR